MRLLIYFIVLVIVTSCKSLDDRNERDLEDISQEFRPYVRQFLDDAKEYNKNVALRKLQIEFSTSELYSDGVKCNGVYYRHEHKILIYQHGKFWQKSPKSLIYHELGHALLNKDHNNDHDKYHQPESIMNLTGITDYAFEQWKEEYLKELFN